MNLKSDKKFDLEDEPTSSDDISLEDVKAALNEENIKTDEPPPGWTRGDAAETVQEEQKEERIKLATPQLFNNTRNDNNFDNMVIPIQDDQHQITSTEKELWLEAMMSESSLMLPIVMENSLTVTCRDLNVYEQNLSIEAVRTLLKDQNASPAMLGIILRQIRLPMQIVKFNNKPLDYIKFDYDPDTEGFTKQKEDIDKLIKLSRQKMLNIPVSLQQIYIKALNVFEHKMVRLEEAAFNRDFWNPADRD